MPRSKSIIRSSVAVGATLLLASAALTLGAGAANATSSSSVVSSIFTKIDANHAAQPGGANAAFLRNGYLDQYAALVNAAEVASKASDDTDIPDASATLQPDYGDLSIYTYHATGSLSSSTATKLAALFDADDIPFHEAYYNDNYAGVSVTVSKGKIYADIVVVGYESTPLDRIIAATPTITGSAHVGVTLTAKQTVTTPETDTTFQWYTDGDEPAGTGTTYTPASDAFGKPVTVKATTTKDGFIDSVLTSTATKALGIGTLSGHTPTVSGSRNVNVQLTAAPGGEWGPGDPDLSYVWYINGKATDNTDSTYTIQAGDKGKTINVQITGTETNFTTLVKSSTSKTKIGNPFLTTSAQPFIDGDNTNVGTILTAEDGGDWGPGTVKKTWQWNVNGKAVSGATTQSFRIPASAFSDVGSTITVTETGSESGYSSVSQTSGETEFVVGFNFDVEGSVTVSGSALVGHTLKAVLPTYSPKPTTIKYEWIINSVVKSTSSSYKVPASAAGQHITLEIFASKSGYATSETGDDDISIPGGE